MEKTMTIVEKFTALAKALADNEITVPGFDVQEFIADRIEKSKSSSTAKGKFALNEEQSKIVEEVKTILATATNGLTVTEIQKKSDFLGGLTTSKVTSAISKMTTNAEKNPNPNGYFVRIMDKKSAKYSLAPTTQATTEE